MRDETIGGFLEALAARVPAPGGGATAALHAAQAAALLGMVARYTNPPVQHVIDATDALRERAVALAAEDAEAFTAVTDAYKLPKATDEEKAARSAMIAASLVGAARPPAEVVATAARLVELAEELLPIGNKNVITDVAAATEAARAAATTARVNIEINLGGIKDAGARAELAGVAAGVDDIARRAAAVTEAVREGLK
ncbi:hypothetical protein Afil01_16850 [Actinorhabdospora filicis]|uniref:Cyclodeaminase/cyclohydrolase domain-containing protein n=1 Tax=Actinorhabdospora filicis TaxID=1785913 RepID=A0A9W6SIG4_9ACTN|nr:cyclodeaminase/cyclohydrolase family protein [Actinorhabdospora filicis]GLZ76878.1 hypothetical protein Afil01_16850 [Actinorhabdospora filicis]